MNNNNDNDDDNDDNRRRRRHRHRHRRCGSISDSNSSSINININANANANANANGGGGGCGSAGRESKVEEYESIKARMRMRMRMVTGQFRGRQGPQNALLRYSHSERDINDRRNSDTLAAVSACSVAPLEKRSERFIRDRWNDNGGGLLKLRRERRSDRLVRQCSTLPTVGLPIRAPGLACSRKEIVLAMTQLRALFDVNTLVSKHVRPHAKSDDAEEKRRRVHLRRYKQRLSNQINGDAATVSQDITAKTINTVASLSQGSRAEHAGALAGSRQNQRDRMRHSRRCMSTVASLGDERLRKLVLPSLVRESQASVPTLPSRDQNRSKDSLVDVNDPVQWWRKTSLVHPFAVATNVQAKAMILAPHMRNAEPILPVCVPLTVREYNDRAPATAASAASAASEASVDTAATRKVAISTKTQIASRRKTTGVSVGASKSILAASKRVASRSFSGAQLPINGRTKGRSVQMQRRRRSKRLPRMQNSLPQCLSASAARLYSHAPEQFHGSSGRRAGRNAFPMEPAVTNGNVHSDEHPPQSSDDELQFDAHFESGNLLRSERVSQSEYNIWIRPDTPNSRFAQWFFFAVSNTRRDRLYKFNLLNLRKTDSMFNYGMKPLVMSIKRMVDDQVGWHRFGHHIVYFQSGTSSGVVNAPTYTLSISFTFEHDDDTCYMAHCYPYTVADLRRFVSHIIKGGRASQVCRRQTLCRTVGGHICDVLTITDMSRASCSSNILDRPVVVISARVHPGESNSSWVMHGLVEFLCSSDPVAVHLRDTVEFRIVPMLNPDGVACGNYRSNLAGVDLNRCWRHPSSACHPTVHNLRALIKNLRSSGRNMLMYVDIHGHSRKPNAFMYGCVDDKKQRLKVRLMQYTFPILFADVCPLFSLEDCRFRVHQSKRNTGRVVVWYDLGVTMSYTLECSFAGGSSMHYTPAEFERIGRDFAIALDRFLDPAHYHNASMRARKRFSAASLKRRQTLATSLRRNSNSIGGDDHDDNDEEDDDDDSEEDNEENDKEEENEDNEDNEDSEEDNEDSEEDSEEDNENSEEDNEENEEENNDS